MPPITVHFSTPPPETRICLDPWGKVFIRADGQVCLCCFAPPVGSLTDDGLGPILNGEEAMKYRYGLLTGELMPACLKCPEKPHGTRERLTELVTKFLETGEWFDA